MYLFLNVLTIIATFGIGVVLGGITLMLKHDAIFESFQRRRSGVFRYKLLVEAVNANKNGMFICTVDGDIVFTNKAFCDLLGYTRDDMLNKTFQDLTPPQHRDQDAFFLDRAINYGLETFELRKEYLKSDGTKIPVTLQVSSLRNSKGDVTFFIVNAQLDSITESNIVINNRYFETAFVNSLVGMAVVAKNGSIVRCNDALAHMLGYTKAELAHKTFKDITYPPDLPKDLSLFQRVIDRDIDTYTLEKRYIGKNGQLIPGTLSVSGVYDEAGKLQTMVGQLQIDVTRIGDQSYLNPDMGTENV